MVGTLHQFGVPIPGAARLLSELQERRVPFVILTNEDRDTKSTLLSNLHAILDGVRLSHGHLFTASDAASRFFARKLARGWRGSVYVVGEEGLLRSLREAFASYEDTGSCVLTLEEPLPSGAQQVDFVVVGSVYSGTEAGARHVQSLEAACAHLGAGAKLLCSCPDDFEVTKAGVMKLGSPGLAATFLEKVTGSGSYILGKPNPWALREAWGQMVEHYGGQTADLHFSDALYVGDSLGTDVSLALQHDMDSALVLSGTTSRDVLALSSLTPSFVFDSIADVHAAVARGELLQPSGYEPRPEAASSPAPDLGSASPAAPEPRGPGRGGEGAYGSFIFDMDGVIHRCGVPIPGAEAMLLELLANEVPFVIMTNECRYSNAVLREKLHSILPRVRLAKEHVFTAGNSAKAYLRQKLARGWRGSVYVIGEEGLLANVREALEGYDACGVLTLDEPEPRGMKAVDYVVVGSVFSTTEGGQSYVRSLERACHFARAGAEAGAKVVCSAPDDYEVTESGQVLLGSPGPSVRTLQSVTGKCHYPLGKPNPHALRAAWGQMAEHYRLSGRAPELTESLFVGDSLGTDIRTALEHDIDCALVLTGTANRESLAKSPLTPTFVFPSIAELHSAYVGGELCRGA